MTRLFPGVISPLPRGFAGSVYDLTLDWWRVYLINTRNLLNTKG